MKKIFTLVLYALTFNAYSQILTTHLVAYYPFSGNANDMSGNGYNGIAYGPTLTTDRFNNPNSAYNFNGVSNYIDLSSYISYLNFSQPASFSFWVNTKYDLPMAIFSTYNGASSDIGSVIYIGNNVTGSLNNELITIFQRSTISNYYITGFCTTNRNLLLLTGWHHVAVVYNGTLTKIYLDNSLMALTCNWGANNGQYGNLSITSFASIGARYNNGYQSYFKGDLDDIRIYNIALTPAQVDTIYHETITSIENTPDNISTINIYPNPTKGKFNIDCNCNIKSVNVSNILGKIIYYSAIDSFQKNYEIELKNAPKGIYFVKINDGEKIHTKKLVTN